MEAAARAGFGAVEDPEAWRIPAEDWRARLSAAELGLAQVGIYGGDRAKGEKGIAGLPDRRAEFRDTFDEGLDFAAAVGSPLVHVMAGIVPRASRGSAHLECLAENLAHAQTQAARRGLRVIVEPMCREAVPDYLIATPAEATAVIDAAGVDGIGLLLDVYHTAAEGLDPSATIRDLGSRIAHVHLSDYPGRHEPGTGGVDFVALCASLSAIGYSGALGCEYEPARATSDGLDWIDRLTTKEGMIS
ncbi:hydroxypyruvate isomerase family protein [Roseitranquillus sediminis]|uniref:hydroxypyruvate isomerase family protein n=1 Tax=Roseitranquillus sediminis TaxID=2809051 RepID=UPI001D0BFD6F|nr:TIM barrel protein [Roseitranquillus sediminis]